MWKKKGNFEFWDKLLKIERKTKEDVKSCKVHNIYFATFIIIFFTLVIFTLFCNSYTLLL